jgi:hypothetical protein
MDAKPSDNERQRSRLGGPPRIREVPFFSVDFEHSTLMCGRPTMPNDGSGVGSPSVSDRSA